MADYFVITIARGFGSGGKQIASMVARNLGIHCYENRESAQGFRRFCGQ